MTDPERWLTSADAPAHMADLLAQARAEMPEAAVVERVASRLPLAAPRSGVAWLPRLVGVVVVGGITAFAVGRGSPTSATQVASGPAAAEPVKGPATLGQPSAPIGPEPPIKPISETTQASPALNEVKPGDTRPSELALIRGAREVLSGQPGRSLQLLEQHRRLYPSGKLAEEREVLAIDALRLSGQTSAAELRLARFIAAYPASAHRPRLERKANLASESAAPKATDSK